jgi:hypothetical protein
MENLVPRLALAPIDGNNRPGVSRVLHDLSGVAWTGDLGYRDSAGAGSSARSTTISTRSWAGTRRRSATGGRRLEPIRRGVRHAFGSFGMDVARGLSIRCGWGLQDIQGAARLPPPLQEPRGGAGDHRRVHRPRQRRVADRTARPPRRGRARRLGTEATSRNRGSPARRLTALRSVERGCAARQRPQERAVTRGRASRPLAFDSQAVHRSSTRTGIPLRRRHDPAAPVK